jgi:hypothetical protein
MVDLGCWACDTCAFDGKFGAGDTIQRHVQSAGHVKALAAVKGQPVGKQQTMLQLWGKGLEQGMISYPANFVPGPADVAEGRLRDHFRGHRCHGFYSDVVQYGSESVFVRGMKEDLFPGVDWYADPHYRASVLRDGVQVKVEGTFRHFGCEGFDCGQCPFIPTLPEFRARALKEAKAEVKRGERILLPGIRLEVLQRVELLGAAREWQARFDSLASQNHFLSQRVFVTVGRVSTARLLGVCGNHG